MNKSCKNCKWWFKSKKQIRNKKTKNTNDYGFCRRYAPKPRTSRTEGWFSCEWPETQDYDWCGEWHWKEHSKTNALLNE